MTFFLFALVVAVSFCIEAIIGFGASVLILALGASLYPIEVIVPLFMPVNLFLSLYFAVRGRRQIDRHFVLGRVLPVMGGGVLLGFALSSQIEGLWMKLLFGVFVLVLSTIELWRCAPHWRSSRPKATPVPLSAPAEIGWLFFAGVVYGVYTTGGPMVVYCASRRIVDKSVLRGTLSAVWFLMGSSLTAAFVLAGKINPDTLGRSVFLFVPLLLGILAGEWLHPKIPAERFRPMVYVLLLFASLFLIGSTLHAML